MLDSRRLPSLPFVRVALSAPPARFRRDERNPGQSPVGLYRDLLQEIAVTLPRNLLCFWRARERGQRDFGLWFVNNLSHNSKRTVLISVLRMDSILWPNRAPPPCNAFQPGEGGAHHDCGSATYSATAWGAEHCQRKEEKLPMLPPKEVRATQARNATEKPRDPGQQYSARGQGEWEGDGRGSLWLSEPVPKKHGDSSEARVHDS